MWRTPYMLATASWRSTAPPSGMFQSMRYWKTNVWKNTSSILLIGVCVCQQEYIVRYLILSICLPLVACTLDRFAHPRDQSTPAAHYWAWPPWPRHPQQLVWGSSGRTEPTAWEAKPGSTDHTATKSRPQQPALPRDHVSPALSTLTSLALGLILILIPLSWNVNLNMMNFLMCPGVATVLISHRVPVMLRPQCLWGRISDDPSLSVSWQTARTESSGRLI